MFKTVLERIILTFTHLFESIDIGKVIVRTSRRKFSELYNDKDLPA